MLSALGWTLIHATWEAGALAVLLALALWIGRRASATTRYAMSLIALMTAAVLPVMTTLATRHASDVSPSISIALPQSAPAARTAASERVGPVRVSRPAAAQAAVVATFGDRVNAALPWLDLAWLVGVLLLSVRIAGGVVRIRRLESHARVAGERVRAVPQCLAQRVGIRAAFRVLESNAVDVPMVIGWVRPAVVVPVGLLTGFAPAHLEMVIAHELAHIRRHDTLVNLAQTIVETLLFYHPAIWWLSARVREEREHCCDDLALAVTGSDRSAYGAMLLQLEESRVEFALTAAATDGSLLRRVKRIVLATPPRAEFGATWVAGATMMLLALALVAPSRELIAARHVNAPVAARPSGPSRPALDSAPTRHTEVPSISAVHSRRRDTVMRHPTRILATAATAVTVAAANLSAQTPNISGRWTLVADSSPGNAKPQSRVIDIRQNENSVTFAEDAATLTFSIESSDTSGSIRLKGPTSLTVQGSGISFRIDSVADGPRLHAQWAGANNIELDVKSTKGTLNFATMTLSLDSSGQLVVRIEDTTQHAGVHQSVQYYRRN